MKDKQKKPKGLPPFSMKIKQVEKIRNHFLVVAMEFTPKDATKKQIRRKAEKSLCSFIFNDHYC